MWAGALAAVLGVVIYAVQLNGEKLPSPWYAPALATCGTLLVIVSLARRFTAWRVLALLLVGALTASEWWFLLSAAKSPPVPEQLAAGKRLPEFTAARSDGTAFTQDDLKGDQTTALVFFRGHW